MNKNEILLEQLKEIYKVTDFSVIPLGYQANFLNVICQGEALNKANEKEWSKKAKTFLSENN